MHQYTVHIVNYPNRAVVAVHIHLLLYPFQITTGGILMLVDTQREKPEEILEPLQGMYM